MPDRGRYRAGSVLAELSVAGIALALALAGCSGTGHADPVATATAGGSSGGAGASGAGGAGRSGSAALSGSYVALGDSYASGPDLPDQVGKVAGCEQSNSSYPYLVARSLRLKLTDVSCGSATIASLSAPETTGDGTNPAQLSALSSATRLVTLGIGGNDVGWAGVITKCVELDLIPALIPGGATSADARCQAYYGSGSGGALQRRIQDTAVSLADALTAIRQRAPDARVYVVGYPDLLPAGGGSCGHTLGLTEGDVRFLNDEELRLNSALQQAARAAGDGYADTYAPSAGHDACAAPASRWIEPLLPAAPAAPLHPNATGERGMAAVIEHAVMAAA